MGAIFCGHRDHDRLLTTANCSTEPEQFTYAERPRAELRTDFGGWGFLPFQCRDLSGAIAADCRCA